MTQTRTQSLAETLASVAIGYIVAVISQLVILPWFGVELTLSENFTVALWFTGVSIARGYVARRVFNRIWR